MPWFCPSFRTWQNTWPGSTPERPHYGPFINNLASISLTSPPSESSQRINKPGLNDPWHHICLCRWVHSGAICARRSVSSSGRGGIFCLSHSVVISRGRIDKITLKRRWLWAMFGVTLAGNTEHALYIGLLKPIKHILKNSHVNG